MTWFPISHTVPQYADGNGDPYSGAILKAYSDGTSTAINFATDSAGATTVATITLNASGYPTVSGNVVLPYLEEKYKLSLYPTQAAADANTGAIWTIDGVPISGDFGADTQSISTTTALDSADKFNHIEASGTITITEPAISGVGAGFVHTIRNAGTGGVTLDGDGAETINGKATEVLAPGDGALVLSDATSLYAIISRAAHGAKGSDVVSATTTEIWQTSGELIHVTGTTTITSLGTAARAGEVRVVIFDDALTLTNGANLVLQGSSDITTAAGDIAFVFADTTTKHYVSYFKASGAPIGGTVLVDGGGTGQTSYTDGQLLIGNTTGNTLTKATLTAGSGISITNGSGSISIAVSTVGTSQITDGSVTTAKLASGEQMTTTNVLAATAGAAAGAVGSYAFLRGPSGAATLPNATTAGSGLNYADASGGVTGSSLSGTWRAMGNSLNRSTSTDEQGTTLWLRIS